MAYWGRRLRLLRWSYQGHKQAVKAGCEKVTYGDVPERLRTMHQVLEIGKLLRVETQGRQTPGMVKKLRGERQEQKL